MSGLYFFLPKGTAVTVFYEVRGLLMSALQDLIKKYTSIIVVDSPEGMPSTSAHGWGVLVHQRSGCVPARARAG